jgi:hypothetical protein
MLAYILTPLFYWPTFPVNKKTKTKPQVATEGGKIMKHPMTTLCSVVFGLVAFSSAANAAEIDQYPVANAEFANAYKAGSTSATVNLLIENSGATPTIILSHSVYSYSQGINNYWRGEIPATAVTVNGTNQVSVSVDTCAYNATTTLGTDACGVVDVTFNKADFQWKTDGSINFSWDPLVNTINGGILTFSADVTGNVKGVDMTGAFRSAMGKYTNVSVTVELPDAAN